MYNTINAHRVSEWCLKEYGREKQVELYEHMIRNYFEKRINVHVNKFLYLLKFSTLKIFLFGILKFGNTHILDSFLFMYNECISHFVFFILI